MAPIPLSHPTLDRVRALVPPQHLLKTFVAGSAACRYPQNADVDVWVTRLRQPLWEAVLRHFEDLGYAPSVEALQEYGDLRSLLVYSHDGLQILLSAEDITQVLLNFDITCHMAALNVASGKVRKHAQYTEEVRLNLILDRRKTLQRAARFAARYGDTSAQYNERIMHECDKLGSEGMPWRQAREFHSGLTLPMMVEEGL